MSLIQNGTNALEQQVNYDFAKCQLKSYISACMQYLMIVHFTSFQFAGLDLKQGGPFAAGGR
jgi:hypothetical protein